MTVKSSIALAILCLAPVAALADPAAAPAAAEAAAPAAESAAAPAEGKGKRWQACAADIEKFCATVEKGKGLKRACLEGHSAELSESCKTRLAEHAARAKDKAAQ